ncbi:MAG TPA: hypothetical protein VGF94_10930 [Kofleriaceae bacterium]
MPDLAAMRVRLAEHPWSSVGIAALAGATLGFMLGGAREHVKSTVSTKLGEVLLAGLGALAVRIAKDAALEKLGAIALDWWDEAQSRTARDEPTVPLH